MELEPSSPSGDGMDETTIDEVLGSGGADSRSPGDVLVSALWRAVLDIQSYAQRQHHGTLCQVNMRLCGSCLQVPARQPTVSIT